MRGRGSDVIMLNSQASEPSRVEGVDPAAKPTRRSFTAEYRASVLAEYEAAPHGEKSAVLRCEGIHQTRVGEWARARDAAAAGGSYRRDRKPRSKDPSAAVRAVKLEAENKRLARQLEQTQAALDVMGKAHRLLELLSMSTDESHPDQTRGQR